jgi:hypothetical protein
MDLDQLAALCARLREEIAAALAGFEERSLPLGLLGRPDFDGCLEF